MKINEFQKVKGRLLITSGPNETVHATIQKLAENNIGALPVCDANGKLLGIVTERDLLKECAHRNTTIGSAKVKDIMTKEVAIGIPEDDISYVMEVMIQKGIRHLPVMSGTKLIGMISARDIVEHQLEESRAKVRYLSDYLTLVTAIMQSEAVNTSK